MQHAIYGIQCHVRNASTPTTPSTTPKCINNTKVYQHQQHHQQHQSASTPSTPKCINNTKVHQHQQQHHHPPSFTSIHHHHQQHHQHHQLTHYIILLPPSTTIIHHHHPPTTIPSLPPTRSIPPLLLYKWALTQLQNKSLDKGWISVDRSNKGYSTTYNTSS